MKEPAVKRGNTPLAAAKSARQRRRSKKERKKERKKEKEKKKEKKLCIVSVLLLGDTMRGYNWSNIDETDCEKDGTQDRALSYTDYWCCFPSFWRTCTYWDRALITGNWVVQNTQNDIWQVSNQLEVILIKTTSLDSNNNYYYDCRLSFKHIILFISCTTRLVAPPDGMSTT